MRFKGQNDEVLQFIKKEEIQVKDKKYALVLEGGGAKGAYEAGVMSALEALDIEIEAVVGTSIGALNGALIAQGDLETLYDLWYKMKPSMLMAGDEVLLEKLMKFDFSSFRDRHVMAYINKVILEGGLDISPMKETIDACIDEEKIRNSSTAFGLVTVSLTDMKPIQVFLEDIPKGYLKEYLIASSHLPVFKTERMHGKIFLDGGFYNNFPIEMLVNRGYKRIIGVELQSLGRRKKTDLKDCQVTLISPKVDLGGSLELSAARSRANMSLGFFDTLKHFYKLKGKNYYIKSSWRERDIMLKLTNVFAIIGEDSSYNDELREIYGSAYKSNERLLFEALIPQLAEILKLPKEATYEEILIGLLEFAADYHDLDKFRIYTLNELIEAVKVARMNNIKKGKSYMEREVEHFAKYLKGTKLYFYSNKEEVLFKTIDAFLNGL